MRPTVSEVTMLEPVHAPNMAQAPTVARAIPPRRCPKHRWANSKALRARPARRTQAPEMMNSGRMMNPYRADWSKSILGMILSATSHPSIRV